MDAGIQKRSNLEEAIMIWMIPGTVVLIVATMQVLRDLLESGFSHHRRYPRHIQSGIIRPIKPILREMMDTHQNVHCEKSSGLTSISRQFLPVGILLVGCFLLLISISICLFSDIKSIESSPKRSRK